MSFFAKFRFCLVGSILLLVLCCQNQAKLPTGKKGPTLPLKSGDEHVMLGLKAYKQAHFEVAEAQLEASLDKPRVEYKTEEVLVMLGNVHQELGQYDKAFKNFKQALEVNPQYYTAWVNQGILYRLTKKPDEAMRCYNEALKIAPNDPYLLTSLGALSATKKEYTDAIALFKKSIHLDPTLTVSYSNLAYTYAEMGDSKNANTYLDIAVERGFGNSKALEQKIQKIAVKK